MIGPLPTEPRAPPNLPTIPHEGSRGDLIVSGAWLWRVAIPHEWEEASAWVPMPDGQVVPVVRTPHSVKSWDADAQRQVKEAEARDKQVRKRLRLARVPITAGHMRHAAASWPTLRAAYEYVAERMEGLVEVRNSRLYIEAQPPGTRLGDGAYKAALEVLFLAEPTVVAWLEGGRKGELPDAPITPAGAVIE